MRKLEIKLEHEITLRKSFENYSTLTPKRETFTGGRLQIVTFVKKRGTHNTSHKQTRLPNGSLVSFKLAGCTGLEPATSDVTGRRSNQLS